MIKPMLFSGFYFLLSFFILERMKIRLPPPPKKTFSIPPPIIGSIAALYLGSFFLLLLIQQALPLPRLLIYYLSFLILVGGAKLLFPKVLTTIIHIPTEKKIAEGLRFVPVALFSQQAIMHLFSLFGEHLLERQLTYQLFNQLEAAPFQWLLLAFYAIILAPIVEEIFFRRMLLDILWEKTNWLAALIISSLIFGLLHASSLAPFSYNWFVAITATSVPGALAGLAYLEDQSSMVCVSFHSGFNAATLILAYSMEMF